MKFVADVMLGRLAKRMRLLGFDVRYDREAADNEIIRLSFEQDRIILTRDTGLAQRPLAANHVLIKYDSVDDQLRQVFETFTLDSAPAPLTRCSLCNEPLRSIAKETTKDLVPEHVYNRYDDFLQCGSCGRIYWRGSHVQRMESKESIMHRKTRRSS